MISDTNIQLRGWSRVIVSAPFIYAPIVPLMLLDIFIELYHHVAFPLYGIPMLSREKYIVYDRHKLSYLTLSEKLHCLYCSYANGLLGYAKDIATETEKMWCPIKHKWHPAYQPPTHHASFANYNDEELLQEYMEKRTRSEAQANKSPTQQDTTQQAN